MTIVNIKSLRYFVSYEIKKHNEFIPTALMGVKGKLVYGPSHMRLNYSNYDCTKIYHEEVAPLFFSTPLILG